MSDLTQDYQLITEADEVAEVELPYNYAPRGYQAEFWKALFIEKKKRICLAWHRRAGKDVSAWSALMVLAVQRPGNYHYYLPTYGQGRKIIWDGLVTSEDGTALRFMDFIPPELIANINNTEMKIRLHNNSIIQVIGVDAGADLIVGTNPVGVVFSEYALQDPMAYEYIRPILAENGGVAIVASTFRGRNHMFQLYEMAKKSEDWFSQLLTIEDTKRPNGEPVITPEAVELERANGMAEELILQEFFCKPTTIGGAYYGLELEKAYQDNRVCRLPIETALDVDTYWDLGVADSTAILLVQRLGLEVRIVDYIEASGEGLPFYIQQLRTWAEKHKVRFGKHYAPHDIEVRELTSGESRKRAAMKMGIKFYVVPKTPLMEGIDMGRRLFPRVWIDERRCERLLAALAEYRKKYNEKMDIYSDTPEHSWASHAADAYRYMAVATRPDRPEKRRPQAPIADTEFDVFTS